MDKFEYFRNKYDISKSLLALNAFFILSIVVMSFAIYTVNSIPDISDKTVPVKKHLSRAFDNIKLQAKAVYVYDIKNGVALYEKNADAQLPLASITKLMMALTAVELLPKDTEITIKKEFLAEEGDSGLLANESWKMKYLLDFSLVSSSNDGARSIASVIGATKLNTTDYDLGRQDFIKKMNEKAQALGLKQTFFINETGLDEGNISGAYGSAKDIESLMQYILVHNSEILEPTKNKFLSLDSDTKEHKAKNTNTDVSYIPGLLASKTGYTDMAGGNLAVAFDPTIGRPIIIVVLGSTIDGRFDDVDKLVKASLEYVRE
ncbi:MAG: D-alanyl-D-alanine carboxypeptidase (penicillin-binding protein 5/6) [Parcubacteria bacterium C7867-006]|nr:MAG: D-alanyl-D-alanine carboxypeptidase (penicillin-binding protein 5/6) [Parcubacteria bacterium C7867-006]